MAFNSRVLVEFFHVLAGLIVVLVVFLSHWVDNLKGMEQQEAIFVV
ncbi:hypothetical protein NWE55_13785 [Myroides albus]|nr:hypothetical protein [Myroides albus]UVD79184.1 hypothetical protein NWE55_13785 [Myroides albus]